MTEQVEEPGQRPVVQVEPGEGSEAPRRSPEKVAPKPESPPPAKPKVEVRVRRLPTAFYVGAGVAAFGVVVMLWAAWRRDP